MLSIQDPRKTPSFTEAKSDPKQGQLNALADLIVEAYLDKALREKILNSPHKPQTHKSTKQVNFKTMLRLLTEAERDNALERVSVLEFDGKMKRGEAEKVVIQDFLEAKAKPFRN